MTPPPDRPAATPRESVQEHVQGKTENDQQQEPELPPESPVLDRLTRLRTTGFRKLRAGRIHVRCYGCGRKVSNTVRMEYDPPAAVLIETPCERCCMGKDPESFYFDATGEEIVDQYCDGCGCFLGGGMVERASEALCVECADDGAPEHPERALVLAVDRSRSSPDNAVAVARSPIGETPEDPT